MKKMKGIQVLKKMGFWIKNLILTLFILSLFLVLLYKYTPIYYTSYMLVANAKQVFSGHKPHIRHEWKPLSEISPQLPKAIIASEDYLFLIHNGFDSDNENVQFNRGARILYQKNLTITQQTARNIFLPPGETFLTKLMETYFTILIELVWGKERIMEAYLNSIQMGKDIYGAEAAAQAYYAIPANDINIAEAAGIAACLINPADLNPCEPNIYLLRRQAKIRNIMEDMIEIQWKQED
ncbi:MAG: Monofunctional biosynthetic peptidoglycan transglycosylase [Candidatus Ordinivivax streblomastigis]|uniref:Monofunctional biosynthetic peptidoglycan transglycosylase n=1 Tax=Candidatus Ordinivivax streblomastigis TaxID=2540710 RepID=A0A5M8NZV5_9BACT|nr:MAG: Monofunctional biosynthetic peptidoglycan transglycosylase [Candidatus Ordinivivax streblomastigis]